VAIWIWLTRIFASAIPTLTSRSVGPLSSLNDPEKGVTMQESTALIVKNYASLKDDLQILNKLMHIARNLLVTTDPEVPQDICAVVAFDQMVYQTIILCISVTSKGYGADMVDDTSRTKLNEITEQC
jgi:palmitoyltransferase